VRHPLRLVSKKYRLIEDTEMPNICFADDSGNVTKVVAGANIAGIDLYKECKGQDNLGVQIYLFNHAVLGGGLVVGGNSAFCLRRIFQDGDKLSDIHLIESDILLDW
jgi:hypothetical protein